MLTPVLMDDGFLADVTDARVADDSAHLWWLGQSGFLLQWRGRHLLMDPYLSDSLTLKYANTDRPHVRMTERVIGPERLDFIDVVTSSHSHTDHLDAATLKPLLRANPRLEMVIPEANREVVVDRLNVMAEWPRGLDVGHSAHVASFIIHGVPAAHNQVETDSGGRHKFLGYVIEAGPWVFYHAGDTIRYPQLEVYLQRWRIDVAILPINGDNPTRGVAGNMNGREAAQLAKDLKVRLAIPCHYDMFEFNTASPEEFCKTAEALSQPYRVLRAGERWSTHELGPPIP